jgi:hypothetical protein
MSGLEEIRHNPWPYIIGFVVLCAVGYCVQIKMQCDSFKKSIRRNVSNLNIRLDQADTRVKKLRVRRLSIAECDELSRNIAAKRAESNQNLSDYGVFCINMDSSWVGTIRSQVSDIEKRITDIERSIPNPPPPPPKRPKRPKPPNEPYQLVCNTKKFSADLPHDDRNGINYYFFDKIADYRKADFTFRVNCPPNRRYSEYIIYCYAKIGNNQYPLCEKYIGNDGTCNFENLLNTVSLSEGTTQKTIEIQFESMHRIDSVKDEIVNSKTRMIFKPSTNNH